jgi:6-phosphogluconolactonase
MDRYRIFPDAEAVARAAADYLCARIKHCVTSKGLCHVVLPGGSTPARCLELLAAEELPWEHVHWYPGDERCYPDGHAERNDTMIREKLFTRAAHCIHQFHAIPAELGAERAAVEYAALLDKTGGMDIVVLGMGEDGHTASLFPGNSALYDQHSAVAVFNAPKAPDERVSIGLSVLKNAAERVVIATGENKSSALASVHNGVLLPVGMIEPTVWFVDKAAMQEIEKE